MPVSMQFCHGLDAARRCPAGPLDVHVHIRCVPPECTSVLLALPNIDNHPGGKASIAMHVEGFGWSS
eukprot:6803796-Alexandrium_andersonii.AAC.1